MFASSDQNGAASSSTPASTKSQSESSQNQQKIPKPAKPPKDPKDSKSAKPATVDGPGGKKPKEKEKEKSAKDMKKEKRAAAVAARGEVPEVHQGTASGSSSQLPKTSNPSTSHGQPHSTSSHPSHAGQNLTKTNTNNNTPMPSIHANSSFFSHIPILTQPSTIPHLLSSKIHPAVLKLGLLMSTSKLRGSNARTVGLLESFKQVIRDYKSPDDAVLWKDLPAHLSPMIGFLESCRPKGAGGGNAIRWLKGEINKLGEEGNEVDTEAEQKELLISKIDNWIYQQIEIADVRILEEIKGKIRPGDVIVTYARSSIVEKCLIETWREMTRDDPTASFEVVVIDSAPLHEGKDLLRSLTLHNIPTTYTLLPLSSSLIARSTICLLGASAMYSNGSLLSRAGTCTVATLAKYFNVPVIVTCETYKFSENTRLDGLGGNEVTFDWDEMSSLSGKQSGMEVTYVNEEDGGDDVKNGNLIDLGLTYDLTPADSIYMLCTERGCIPPTSVPTAIAKYSGVA